MKLAIFASLFALSASANPLITSISPASGPVAGGTEVTIKGSGFVIFCAPVADPCVPVQPVIHFGGIAAASFRLVDANTVVAVTPPHLPATVTVFLSQSDGSTQLDGFTFTGAASDGFERILIPIFVPPVDGAYGTKFVTEYHIANRGLAPLPVYGINSTCMGCLPPNPFETPLIVAPGADLLQPPSGNPGRIMWIPKASLPEYAGNLRVRDTARAEQSGGSEIPLPRDAAFRSDSIVLLGVPFEARFRVKVRVYSADPAATAVIIDAGATRVAIPLRAGNDIFAPAYGEYSDFNLPPPPPETTAIVTQKITVQPMSAGTRIWAFATSTSNASQEITVISPQ